MDSFTQEVIQDSLNAISEEMFAAMARAAMSSVIYEVLDFGVAVTDAEGNLASVGAGIPGFVGMLAPAVQAVLGRHPRPSIAPGDIFIANDPYEGGVSHANDVVLAMPVFSGDRLIAWTANKGHWVDIGGMTPGSMSPNATELFQEGLILPPLKLFEAGSPVEAVFAIIRANSRLPDQALGDLWAGVAALRVGERRLRELCGKYGRNTLVDAIRAYMDYGETMALSGLAALPRGEFRGTDRLDDGREIRALIRISRGGMTIDLRDNPDRDDGPVNGTRDATLVGARAVFKSITLPEPWANAGCFRPLKVLTRPGSIFHAQRPAAVGLYYENKMRSKDLILKTLAPHMPARIPAGHFASICATVIRSRTPGGEDKTFVEPQVGGWGAGHDRDGDSAQFSISHGDTFNCPVEVNESRNGIRVRRYALNSAPSGAGQFRGGKGVELHYEMLSDRGSLTAGYTRCAVPPWGLDGGGDGSGNRVEIDRCGHTREAGAGFDNAALRRGDVVRIVTGNGGGYGNPARRCRQQVLEDLRNGYVSVEEAVNTYRLSPQEAAAAAGS
ncbi:MAG: hydantoinase B/oxoprolinase family protein [Gammaproteobacteria bacterium]|nr:hydantoinase B/oxoprolinase family protein [Gammaproteobacteria bacterium]